MVGADSVPKKLDSVSVIKIASFTSSATIDISNIRSDFENLTIDDFLIVVTGISAKIENTYNGLGLGSGSKNVDILKSYNPESGILTITGANLTVSQSNSYNTNKASVALTCDVYA